MNAPPLRYLVSADDKASATFQRIRREMGQLQASTEGFRRLIGPIGVQFASAFTVAALGGWVKNVVQGIDKLGDLRAATGASIENLSALERIAQRTGTSIDTAGDAVLKLNQVLNAAKPDSEQAKAIKAIGLSVEELKRLDPAEALRRVAVALSGFADDGNKGRLTMALLGKSARELAPFLGDLAEAGKLVATVTTEQYNAASKLQDELDKLGATATELSRTLGIPLVSSLNQTIDKLREGSKEAKGFWETLLAMNRTVAGEQWKLLGFGGSEVQTLDQMNSRMRELNSLLDTNRRLGLAIGQAPKLEAERKALQAQIDAARANMKSAFLRSDKDTTPVPRPSVGDLGGDKPPPAKKPTPIKVDTTPDFDPYLAALKEMEGTDHAKIGRLSATLGELLQLQSAGMAGPGTAQAIQSVTEQLQNLDPAARRAADAKKYIDDLLGIGADSSFSRYLDQLQELQRRLDSEKISTDAYITALTELDGKWRKTADGISETSKTVGGELALVFSSAAGEAITQWKGVKDVLKGVLADLAQIAVRETVTKRLGSWLTALLTAADGHAFDGRGVIPFAAGGVVTRPTLFGFAGGTGLMGEAGPEAIMPLRRGRDGRLGVDGGGGGGITVHQTNNYTNVNRNELALWAEATKRETIAAIVDAQRRGLLR